jgi:hypothetical protein
LTCTKGSFFEFEQRLFPQVYELGRLFITLFLWMRQEHWQANHPGVEKGSKCQGLKDRLFGTVFGKVRYWRTYIYRGKNEGGYYPLDLMLGLPWDGFSMLVRSYAVRLAVKMSYAQCVAVLSTFLKWSPCQKTMEEMVLGLGKHTGQWFESAPAPENDGEVLIVQIALVFAISSVCLAAEVEDYSITINVFKESPAVVKFFENSYGYAVFPPIEKAGFVIGGSYGKGQVYRNGKVTGITKVFLSFPRIAWERAYKPKHDNSPYVMCV